MSIFKRAKSNYPVFTKQEVNDILLAAAILLDPQDVTNERAQAAVYKIQAITEKTQTEVDGSVTYRLPPFEIIL